MPRNGLYLMIVPYGETFRHTRVFWCRCILALAGYIFYHYDTGNIDQTKIHFLASKESCLTQRADIELSFLQPCLCALFLEQRWWLENWFRGKDPGSTL